MNILVSPSDIIKRTLWSNYKKFVLYDKNEEEIKKLVEEDSPSVISEHDAYVIGLLKCVETDNLIHRFNQQVNEILQLKSIQVDELLLVNKNAILKEIVQFKNRFPIYANLPSNYKKGIEDLNEYLERVKTNTEKLEVRVVKNKDKSYDAINSKHFRKLLDL